MSTLWLKNSATVFPETLISYMGHFKSSAHCTFIIIIIIIIIINIIIIGIQPLGPVWAETRFQSGDWYGSGTLHPGQVLRGSLPLLSPAF